MVPLPMVFSRMWGFYVMNSVITGWALASVNPNNASLFYAWMVSLCDMVYIIDSLARAGKRLLKQAIASRSKLKAKKSVFAAVFILPTKALTYLPFHVLAIYQVDDSLLYSLVCLVRVFIIVASGRLRLGASVSKEAKLNEPLFRSEITSFLQRPTSESFSQESYGRK